MLNAKGWRMVCEFFEMLGFVQKKRLCTCPLAWGRSSVDSMRLLIDAVLSGNGASSNRTLKALNKNEFELDIAVDTIFWTKRSSSKMHRQNIGNLQAHHWFYKSRPFKENSISMENIESSFKIDSTFCYKVNKSAMCRPGPPVHHNGFIFPTLSSEETLSFWRCSKTLVCFTHALTSMFE